MMNFLFWIRWINLVWAKTSIACSLALDMEQPDWQKEHTVSIPNFIQYREMGDFLTWVCLQKGIFCILQKAIFPSHSLSFARLYVHSCRRFVGGVVVDSSRSIVCSLLQKYLFKQKCFHIIYHGQMRTEQIYLLHHGTIYDSRLWRGPLCVAMFITRKGCMYVLRVMHFVNQCFEKRFQRVPY